MIVPIVTTLGGATVPGTNPLMNAATCQVDELRKEAEDILAARCRRAAAILERTDSPTVVDGNAFMQVQKDYIEAFGADNYGMLRQHTDAHTRRGDGSLEADLATLIIYNKGQNRK